MMRTTPAGPRGALSPARDLGGRLLVASIVAFLVGLMIGCGTGTTAQVTYTEEGGTLGDGTRYLMRVPSNWNGTLIRDLDYASGASSDRYLYLLEKGYAVSGTARHERRWVGNYDPAREIRHLNTVLDVFEEHFRKPDRVIQYGCSGGGHAGLAIAEDFSDRVDGVIATAAPNRVWLMNTKLDKWFVLKALIAPDLRIVDLPHSSSLRPEYPSLTFAWRQAIRAAQQTPGGRARIALAITIGQETEWTTPTEPNPDRNDVAALQYSMYQSVLLGAAPGRIGGISRYMFENTAGFERSTQLSWNTGVDYREFFNNGNEFNKRAVRQLYQEAGLDLQDDLERINAFPRISADEEAIEWWSAPGRNYVGDPKVPVLRMHEIGDPLAPLSLAQGYTDLVRANGKDDLYRTAIIEAPTHCGFTPTESHAVIETMMRRLDTGSWGSTDPEHLNELARSLDESYTSRFIPGDQYMPVKYNRMWTPPDRD